MDNDSCINLASIDAVVDTNFTYLEMDPNISDSEMAQDQLSEASLSFLDQDDEDGVEQDDTDLELHPAIQPLSMVDSDISGQGSLPQRDTDDNLDEAVAFAAGATDSPEIIQRLQKQLLSSYSLPNNPSLVDNPRGHSLTAAEELSLKHYVAWVDSHGTVKGYSLHAQVLQEATGTEILSLYMVRKLAIELTGLSFQLVDMCPKSCMAFTGEYKDLNSCIYVCDRHHGPCGQPH